MLIFFLAPVTGLVVGVAQWLISRDQTIPFGPFLCLGTLVAIVGWPGLWIKMAPYFALGWLVPIAMGCCLVGVGVLLGLWQFVKRRLGLLDDSRA